MENKNIDSFIETIRNISLTAEDFIINLNFILKKLGEKSYEIK